MRKTGTTLVTLLVWAVLCSCAMSGNAYAMNPDSDWQVDLRPGFSWLRTHERDYGGLSLTGGAAWRFWNQAQLRLDLQYAGFGVQQSEKVHFTDATLGLQYELDRLPIVPSFGLAMGSYISHSGVTHRWRTDFGIRTSFDLHYFFGENWALGGAARYHYVATDFPNTPIFLDLALKLVWEF